MIVKSSGHSGRQCYWVRSHNEDKFGKTALSIGLNENFQTDTKKTLIINGFILGSWVTGINFNELASWHCPIINVGPNKEEIFQTILDIGKTFEQIIITGYPPFIKNLVDTGAEQKFPWKKYNVQFIGGGEDFPESWRTYVESVTKGKVRSGFGASDIGILGGMENDDTVFIRQLADKNHALREELFGDVDETPMLFQYPLNLYIYANEQKELIFTTILPEATQPVIKYNLQDDGGTISHDKIYDVFKKYGVKRKIRLPSPFLYIVGRKGGAVNFNAFLIYPENIEDCIYRNKSIERAVTGSFKIQSVFDKHHNRALKIELQLKKGVSVSKKMEADYLKLFVNTLQEVNEGYKATYEKLKEMAIPQLVIYEFEKYPYQGKIKNRYN
jgi:phenylacetate-CoA ligase